MFCASQDFTLRPSGGEPTTHVDKHSFKHSSLLLIFKCLCKKPSDYLKIGVWPGLGLFHEKWEGTDRNCSPGPSFFWPCMPSSEGESRLGDIFPWSSRTSSPFPVCTDVLSCDVFLVFDGMSASAEQHWKGEMPTEGLPTHVSSVTLPRGEGPGVGVGEWWGDSEPG